MVITQNKNYVFWVTFEMLLLFCRVIILFRQHSLKSYTNTYYKYILFPFVSINNRNWIENSKPSRYVNIHAQNVQNLIIS